MGSAGICQGQKVGSNYEFMLDQGNCKITPVMNGTHLIYEATVAGTRGEIKAMISRQHKFVSYSQKISAFFNPWHE